MERVDYDLLAAGYHQRYSVNPLAGIGRVLRELAHGRVLEAGCGTGRWLSELPDAFGIDLSPAMLATSHPRRVAVADAVCLPFAGSTFDFVYCVNALHQFSDRTQYFAEVRRVLRAKGTTTIVTIDPRRITTWFVYEYFAGAREIDVARYAALEELVDSVQGAGFCGVTLREIERTRLSWTADEALASPLLTRESNSLLALLPNEDLARGLDRIRASAPGTGLITDMPFFAITAYLPQL
jgi:SAM-dependent methyltransferase